MDNIKLEGRTIEPAYGRTRDTAPALLARYEKGEGVILSEGDIRLLGVRNFKNVPELANNYWNTSTLCATKGKDVKVILPYETGSRELTDVAKFGLGLINSNEKLVNDGVNLDDEGRWKKLEGSGVYTLQRKGLILNKDLTESEAMKHELLLTKLGHPDFVDSKFARSKDEVAEIIGKTFELGKQEYGYDTMLGQYLPSVNKKGILRAWCVDRLDVRAGSDARNVLDVGLGRFAFDSVGDAIIGAVGVGDDKARTQFQSLEGILQTGQIDQIGKALDERDQLKERLSGLTTDQIYSVIGDYIGSKNEQDVRKALDDLTSQ
jgi:hypothetical protein